MFGRYLFYLKKIDWLIVSLVILLVSIGLLSIYSTSYNTAGQDTSVFVKQLVFVLVGLVAMFGISFIDFRFFRAYGTVILLVGLGLLLLVLFVGTEIRGTKGWIFMGSYGIQPVEFVKMFFIISLARYFSRHGKDIHNPKHIIISGGITIVFLVLIMFQPDFGSAIIYFLIWIGLLFLLNIKRSYLITLLVIISLVATAGWVFGLKDYQKERIGTFLNPSQDSLKTGYNITQSIVAVGSGNLWGRGMGLGPQSQLKFLPEQQTDFIYAVVAEELGLVGAVLVLAFFIVLFIRLINVARKSRDDFSLFVISGVIIMIFLQMFINIGMNIGLVPVVGIPLPFVSAGGSSLVASFIAIGVVQGVIVHRKT
ncbi:rod shape-determining protein RodA [Patescibacteria group bacterium]|nr:rod shape-determining protein RodA [Patescibacteria group bacterium]MBU1891023.1 rod shape-determining protein RodA [Patescibacteria group bacterium]